MNKYYTRNDLLVSIQIRYLRFCIKINSSEKTLILNSFILCFINYIFINIIFYLL